MSKGSSPQPSKPYQGPQFGLQEQLLSSGILLPYLASNPALAQLANKALASDPYLASQAIDAGVAVKNGRGASLDRSLLRNAAPDSFQAGQYVPSSISPTTNFSGNAYSTSSPPIISTQGLPKAAQNMANNLSGGAFSKTLNQGYSQGSQPKFLPQPTSSPFQMPPVNTSISSLKPTTSLTNTSLQAPRVNTAITPLLTSNTSQSLPMSTTANSDRYQGYKFTEPNVNFSERTPFQFQSPNSINVADTYTPQYEMARRDIEEQGKRTQEQMLSDLNRRGLLTTGATTKALDLQRQEQDRKLADLSAKYSIEQGRSQLQEDQARRQLEQERQINQAAELFRQSGATDEQAMFLANQNFNKQQAQAGQNLSAFGANLGAQQQQFGQGLQKAELGMNQQGQAFNQNLSGLQNLLAQQGQAYQQGLSNANFLTGREQQAFNQNLAGQQNLMNQQNQAFQQGLANANLLTGREQQAFQQALQSRGQGIEEMKLANLLQRQPMEDLMRLYAGQIGQIGGTAGNPGIMGTIGTIAGAALPYAFGAFCLPKGTEIELPDGKTAKVENIKIGDEVLGGKVLATTSYRRSKDHKFSLHKFKNGKSVIMTSGHPFYSEIESIKEVDHVSQTTHDILTESGVYVVNGVLLGSTIAKGESYARAVGSV